MPHKHPVKPGDIIRVYTEEELVKKFGKNSNGDIPTYTAFLANMIPLLCGKYVQIHSKNIVDRDDDCKRHGVLCVKGWNIDIGNYHIIPEEEVSNEIEFLKERI